MRYFKTALMIAVVAMILSLAWAAHAQSSATVSIQGYAFQPQSVTIQKGGTVTWTNQDSVVHDVKFSDGDSPDLKKGGTYSKTFDKAGTYDYICNIHPTMKGTVIVK
jgi:amicyanin